MKFILLFIYVNTLYASQGDILLISHQTNAKIFIDDKYHSTTTAHTTKLTLEVGGHYLKVIRPISEKYQAIMETSIQISKEHTLKLNIICNQYEPTRLYMKTLISLDIIKYKRWYQTNDLIIDKKSQLVWQDTRNEVKTTWDDAIEYCHKLSISGYNQWRVPSYNELRSIIDYDRFSPAVIPLFKYQPYSENYWSSDIPMLDAERAWGINLRYGYSNYWKKNMLYYVKCVHTRKDHIK